MHHAGALATVTACALATSLALSARAAPPEGPAAGPAKKLTLERLYSLPWIIGTQPQDPQWSGDSRRLAFLWNDEGTNFYDVWVTDVASQRPQRVTSMPRPTSPDQPGTDVDRLQQVERAERDHGVSEVLWAADGRHLVFGFHGQLYQVQPGQLPRRLADSGAPQSDAAAAPRGSVVAFLSAGGLWTVGSDDPGTTATQLYAPGTAGIAVESFRWSPDGTQIAFVETDVRNVKERGIPDYLGEETRLVTVRRAFPGEPAEAHRVGIVPAGGGPVRWASLGGGPEDLIFTVAWSPDGRTVLVDKSDLYIKDRRLLLVDAGSGQATELLREADPNNVTAEWESRWAPDGRGVYFTSDRDNDYHLYYEPLAGGPPRQITSGDWAVFATFSSPRAQALYVVANPGRPEERHVLRVPLKGGAPSRLTSAAGNHAPTPSPDGRWLADIYSNDVTPPDLYLIDNRNSRGGNAPMHQVTHSPGREFGNYRWVAAKYVEFPNVNDGTTLHARVTLPPDFDPARRYPAILGSVYSNTVHNRWGGRVYHPTWGLDQYLAQQGYVVMNVDISGSSGHGKTFRQRIREDYGGVDVDDLFSGVQYLVKHGSVDPRRVGIWGSSYGGLLTAMSLFRMPGVYQAGVAGAPATSLFHAETGEMRTMMAPHDHLAEYEKSSAFLRSGGLRDHLLIIHGMKDDTVLFKDTVTLTERLILQEHDVELAVLPGAPHGWDTEGLAQTRYAFRKLVEHFRRYLGEGPSP